MSDKEEMTHYIYLQMDNAGDLWQTGYFDGAMWFKDEYFNNREDAGNRCNFLNGGGVEMVSTEALLAELKRRGALKEQKYKITDLETGKVWDEEMTVMEIACSFRFPSNADKWFDISPIGVTE